jgi:selenide, water dikinase
VLSDRSPSTAQPRTAQPRTAQPLTRDLVLLGGGHSHAIVLRRWAADRARGRSPEGLRLILVSDGYESAYSGMVPGLMAGRYDHGACHIDLRRLAEAAGALFYCDRAIGLDPVTQRLQLANHPPLRYDWLSINSGSTPQMGQVPGTGAYAIGAKPVPLLLADWAVLLAQVEAEPPRSLSIAIVGGGAGGVELALAMEAGLRPWMAGPGRLRIHVIQRGPQLLPNHGAGARRRLERELTDRGILLHPSQTVTRLDAEMTLLGPSNRVELRSRSGSEAANLHLACDRVIWVTEAAAPAWLAASGLAVDDRGFIAVDDCLRSISHPTILAAGDIASQVGADCPKAGVYAVRQGRPLFENLRALIAGKSPRPYRPQSRILGLIGTGDGRAIASWGSGVGSWSWGPNGAIGAWKDRIDRQFMDQFVAQSQGFDDTNYRLDETSNSIALNSELQARIHDRLLAFIQHSYPLRIEFKFVDSVTLGWQPDRDDMTKISSLISTISDPLVQAELMVNHGLNSYVAAGTIPDRFEILIHLEPMSEALLEETLVQSLVGVDRAICAALQIEQPNRTIEVLIAVRWAMTPGIQLWLRPPEALPSPILNPGEALILSKPLGSQALRTANPRQLQPMLSHLTQSNGPARSVLPDATAIAIGSAGFQSTLDRWNQAANHQGAHLVIRLGILIFLNREFMGQTSRRQCLTDPELSGPILFAVPVEQLAIVLKELRGAGYLDCRPIGWVRSGIGAIEFES